MMDYRFVTASSEFSLFSECVWHGSEKIQFTHFKLYMMSIVRRLLDYNFDLGLSRGSMV